MQRRKFIREFKLEAVRLIKDRGVSYAQASEDLNVHALQLRDWVKKFSDDPQHAFPGHGTRFSAHTGEPKAPSAFTRRAAWLSGNGKEKKRVSLHRPGVSFV